MNYYADFIEKNGVMYEIHDRRLNQLVIEFSEFKASIYAKIIEEDYQILKVLNREEAGQIEYFKLTKVIDNEGYLTKYYSSLKDKVLTTLTFTQHLASSEMDLTSKVLVDEEEISDVPHYTEHGDLLVSDQPYDENGATSKKYFWESRSLQIVNSNDIPEDLSNVRFIYRDTDEGDNQARNVSQPKYFYYPEINVTSIVTVAKSGNQINATNLNNYLTNYSQAIEEPLTVENIYSNKIERETIETIETLRIGARNNIGTLELKMKGNTQTIRVGKYYYIPQSSDQPTYDEDAKVIINDVEYSFNSDSQILDIKVENNQTITIQNNGLGRIFLYQISTYTEDRNEWKLDELDTIRERTAVTDALNDNLKENYIEPLQTTVAEHTRKFNEVDDEVTGLADSIDNINSRMSDVQILNNSGVFPKAGYNYLNKILHSIPGNRYYICKELRDDSSTSYNWSFANVTGTAEVTSSNWSGFCQEVPNDFGDVVTLVNLSKFFRNAGSVKLGSSSSTGYLQLRLPSGITKIEIDYKAYTDDENSTFFVNIDQERVATEQHEGSKGILTLVLDELNSPQEITLGSDSDSEKRVLVYAIRVYIGQAPSYIWSPIIDKDGEQSIDNLWVDELKVLMGEFIFSGSDGPRRPFESVDNSEEAALIVPYIFDTPTFSDGLGFGIRNENWGRSEVNPANTNGLTFEYNYDDKDFRLKKHFTDLNDVLPEIHEDIAIIDYETKSLTWLGKVFVDETPTTIDSVTNKKYVDDAIATAIGTMNVKTRTVTINQTDWASSAFSINLGTITVGANDVLFILPNDSSSQDYSNAGITRTISQDGKTLTLTATTVPTNPITIQLVYFKGEAF